MPSQALVRARFLTLAYDDMETIKTLPATFAEAEQLAREWVHADPDTPVHFRVPVEYASVQVSRVIQGPYLYIDGDDTYQLALTPVGLRMEIVSTVPPPEPEEEEEEEPPPPPPPPVFEMPATFNLELARGRTVALDTICATDDDLDMSRTEDGTLVDGLFWGSLRITHDFDSDAPKHTVDFTGTRLTHDLPNDFFLDSRTIGKLKIATKPTTARCTLTITAPSMQFLDVFVELAPMWTWGCTYPQAEPVGEGKVKYFLRVHPDGYLEHFESNLVTTSIYYEAMPDMSQMDPASYISASNGFAMPLAQFIPHISKILDILRLGIPVRTQIVSNALSAIGHHKNIAYRFMPPERLRAAIAVSVSAEPVAFRRIFLMWRGVSDEELPSFEAVGANEKGGEDKDWASMLGIDLNEATAGPGDQMLRILETGIMECS